MSGPWRPVWRTTPSWESWALGRWERPPWPGPSPTDGTERSPSLDLEDPRDLARLSEPSLVLPELRGLVVLDEIQRMPELFPLLRVLADRPGPPARFLILGSASPDLSRQSAESLAGRVSYYVLPGFHIGEVGVENGTDLWIRGGFPRSYLAADDGASFQWREDFVRTFLERDLPALGVRVPSTTLRRFWQMLAHYHGQLWNGAELARAFGVSETAVRNYLDILTDGLVVRQLQPWFENVSKRQVKSPKIFLADSGLVHGLLGLESMDQIEGHPKVGASWEGFVLDQLLTHLAWSGERSTSGQPTPAPSWTSSYSVAEIGWVTRSSARPHRPLPGPCMPPWRPSPFPASM